MNCILNIELEEAIVTFVACKVKCLMDQIAAPTLLKNQPY